MKKGWKKKVRQEVVKDVKSLKSESYQWFLDELKFKSVFFGTAIQGELGELYAYYRAQYRKHYLMKRRSQK